ncbi:hypothetical protein C8N24_0329 [Solirubrobacter pauli]|uniref:Uncharacterized protein n=1 Tax=Solirubrobacter pauli TaxID=166793 RepID=A0A660LBW5_9ACTN|nr:hypothetical protein [Solirubrobacter pauli]RKQ90524.1 hypothetical protein C8N24_0329 [Solirubrobacter pauli]
MPSTFAIDVRTPDASDPAVSWTVCHTLADVETALRRLAPALPAGDRNVLVSELALLGSFSVRCDYGQIAVRREAFNVGQSVCDREHSAPGVVAGFDADGTTRVAWTTSGAPLSHEPRSLTRSAQPAAPALQDRAKLLPFWVRTR